MEDLGVFQQFLEAFWQFCVVSSPYLVLGLVMAGLIQFFLGGKKLSKFLGKENLSSVFKASLIGVPLPLCSCSVIPTAISLRKEGASNAATASFVVSTPESGVDSIIMTHGLLGLPMAIARPIFAFLSAWVAGVLQIIFKNSHRYENEQEKTCCPKKLEVEKTLKTSEKLKESFSYAFGKLMDDMSLWLLIGLILGALVTIFVPESFFSEMNVETSRFLVLLLGIPVYICASATTPLALSLMLKGMSPGVALVLLLAGPATNVTSFVLLRKAIGGKGVLLNIFAVMAVALAASYLVDYLHLKGMFSLDLSRLSAHTHDGQTLGSVCAIFMFFLIAKGIWNENIKGHHH